MVARVIPNVVDVHFRYSIGLQQCENIYSYSYTTVPTGGALALLATEIANAFLPKYQAFTTNAVAFREVFAVDIGTATGAYGLHSFPAGTVGSIAGATAPNNAAGSMGLKTALRGRSNKGRKSFSGFSSAAANQETLSSSVMTALGDLGLQILLTRQSAAFKPVIASLKNHNFHQLTNASMPNNTIDSQKTRLSGHGA